MLRNLVTKIPQRLPVKGTVNVLSVRQYSFSPEEMPSPPKLPKDQQEEFEKLQKIANSQAAIDDYNSKIAGEKSTSTAPDIKTDIGGFSTSYLKTIPEFEGDVNPQTGERGGPKQDPLKYNDWAFNGRVTDF